MLDAGALQKGDTLEFHSCWHQLSGSHSLVLFRAEETILMHVATGGAADYMACARDPGNGFAASESRVSEVNGGENMSHDSLPVFGDSFDAIGNIRSRQRFADDQEREGSRPNRNRQSICRSRNPQKLSFAEQDQLLLSGSKQH